MDIHRIDDDFKNDDSTGSYGFMTTSGIIKTQICRHIKIECNICHRETANLYIPIDPDTGRNTSERGHGGVICDSCADKIRKLICLKGEE